MIHGYGNFKCWQKLLLRSNHSWSNITIDNCMQVNILFYVVTTSPSNLYVQYGHKAYYCTASKLRANNDLVYWYVACISTYYVGLILAVG